jgi:hypothetical protein
MQARRPSLTASRVASATYGRRDTPNQESRMTDSYDGRSRPADSPDATRDGRRDDDLRPDTAPDSVRSEATGDSAGSDITRSDITRDDYRSSDDVLSSETRADAPRQGVDYAGSRRPVAYQPAPRTAVQSTTVAMRRDLVRWGPIVAGLFTSLTTLILLSLLAVGLGITAASSSSGTSQDTLSIGAAATAAVIGIISFFVGGLVAARTAAIGGRGAGALNGFLVWALGVVLILALAAMGLSAILGAAGNVVGATGVPNVNTPNVGPGQVADIGRNSALGAFISLAVPAIAAALGGAIGARTDLDYEEDAA